MFGCSLKGNHKNHEQHQENRTIERLRFCFSHADATASEIFLLFVTILENATIPCYDFFSLTYIGY